MSGYEIQYRAAWTDEWTAADDTTSETASIAGLNPPGYQVRIRAVNSEGESPWSEIIVEELPNRRPTMNAPTNSDDVPFTFPHGPDSCIEFDGAPGHDPDGDSLTYRFAIATTEGWSTPDDVGIRTLLTDQGFTIQQKGTATPERFGELFALNRLTKQASFAIYAHDGKFESEPILAAFYFLYDPSAFFDLPAVYKSEQRYEIETYEGPAADITIPWATNLDGSRTWARARPPTRSYAETTERCSAM